MTMTTFATLFPTFLMLGLGFFARKRGLLTAEQAAGVDVLAFRMLFPVMIFDALFTSGIPAGTGLLVLAVLALRLLSMAAAWLLGRATRSEQAYLLPYLYPSTDGGSVAYPLYATIVGAGFIQNIVMLDLSSMIIAFLVIPVMVSLNSAEKKSARQLVLDVLHNRSVQVMLLGLAANLLGLYGWLQASAWGEVYSNAVSTLTAPLVPLILFGIGYNFKLEKGSMKTLLTALGMRTAVMALGGAALLVLFPQLAAEREMRIAMQLYFVCSPMLALPAVLSPVYKDKSDSGFVSAFLSLSVVVSLVWYIIIAAFAA